MKLYRRLWMLVGGRPWTYIIRDIYHEAEWVIQTFWFGLGFMAGYYLSWKLALIVWGIYTVGYLFGHVHWGTKYIKGQRG